MMQNFTPNALIRFMYQEVSTSEQLAILEALRIDADLHQTYEALKTAQRQLPQVKFNAPAGILQQVLEHSKSSAVKSC
jgi:hypothetical protein